MYKALLVVFIYKVKKVGHEMSISWVVLATLPFGFGVERFV